MRPQVPHLSSYGQNGHAGTHGHCHTGTHGHAGTHGNTGTHGHCHAGTHGHTATHGHCHAGTHGHTTTSYSNSGTGYGGKCGSGGMQVVKTRGEPVYVNSLPLPPEKDETRWSWVTRWCRGCTLFQCLTLFLLVTLVVLALVTLVPHAFKLYKGKLSGDLDIESGAMQKPEAQKHEALARNFDAIGNKIEPVSIQSPIPSAHLAVTEVLKTPGTNTTKWNCTYTIHGESFLLGGMTCEDDMRKVNVPLDGIYSVHARVTLMCKKNIEQSATLVVQCDSYRSPRDLSTVIAPTCGVDQRTAVVFIYGLFELKANCKLSLALSHIESLRIGDKYTSMDVYMLSNIIRAPKK